MHYIFVFYALTFFIYLIQSKSVTEDSPYVIIRLMDLKLYEWKPNIMHQVEKAIDANVKYTDESKTTACKSFHLELEDQYPKQEGRFLDLSIRGICTDNKGRHHDVDKNFLIEVIKSSRNEIGAAATAAVFRIGDIQVYERIRNSLNLIIIPGSISFVILLFVLTFCLRQMRNKQKRRHIIAELKKNKEASDKKAQALANMDPHANDKQRLLQTDPIVVGSVSDTMGSPKEFSIEQHSPSFRCNPININNNSFANRDYQVTSSSQRNIPLRENRVPILNCDEETSFQTQQSLKSNRERMPVPYENESRFSPAHTQYHYDAHYQNMDTMQEQNPRVIVRSIRDDASYPLYQQHPYEETSQNFVSIPVQIEHSSSYQRFPSSPYHSDPYYSHTNS